MLQESRCFHDPQIDPRRCQQVITKLLYLLCQGETFTRVEATEVFFAVTKLFQNTDVNLRRMVYLIIKELSPSSEEVIIVTSSLMKDMNAKIDLYRSNALRVLCHIIDATLLQQIERYVKQAIVDKNSAVASAALVSGFQLYCNTPGAADVVKRWGSEISEAVQSKNSLVQFHGLALLHAIRQNDRLAISKMVTSLTRGGAVRSPLAQCLLVRYVARVISESTPQPGQERPFYEFLESCLRHKAEMVIFEAARAITEMNEVTTRELTPAITVLQLFLSSSKPVLRFAAVRTLNKVAMTHPMAVTNCNIDMESLISDSNRSISTLAITTLLKTGNESSVERLMKQISTFMGDIQDEFKIVVVDAIKSMCIKFPSKYRALMNFLSNILREEGGFEYKRAIVEAILMIIRDIPDAKETGLGHLCEFIEDCEFTYLSTQILSLLGKEAPKTQDPSKYIRYIYNRVILENATVRAAAVSALAKMGAACPDLKPRILVLLRRTLHDTDDEVRDRATLYLNMLGAPEERKALGGEGGLVADGFPFGPANLEQTLQKYLAGPLDAPFELSSVPVAPVKKAEDEVKSSGAMMAAAMGGSTKAPNPKDLYEEMLNAIPEFASLGPLQSSSMPVELTERDTEYVITCVKHMYENHVVFQYNCLNTIDEQVLEDVTVTMDLSEEPELEEKMSLPLKVMPTGAGETPGTTFVVVERVDGAMPAAKVGCMLKFTTKEVDPSTGEAEEEGYADEYQLEDVDLEYTDYVSKLSVGNFRKAWEEMGEETELADEYGIGQREGLQEAVEVLIATLGMSPCEGTDAVPPNARSHMVLLSGKLVGDVSLLVRLSLGIDASSNVAMKLVARADSAAGSEFVHGIIANA